MKRKRYTIEDLLYRCGRWERREKAIPYVLLDDGFYGRSPAACAYIGINRPGVPLASVTYTYTPQAILWDEAPR